MDAIKTILGVVKDPLFSEPTIEDLQEKIDEGSDVNEVNNDGETPLFASVGRGWIRTSQFLLEKGARTDVTRKIAAARGLPDIILSPLGLCIRTKNIEMLHILLQIPKTESIDVDEPNIEVNGIKMTPLMFACGINASEAAEMVKLIVEVGKGSVNLKVKGTPSALHVCLKWDSDQIAKFLLEKGAEIDVTDPNGLTPLLSAANLGAVRSFTVIATHMIELKGIDSVFSQRDTEGNSVVHVASRKESSFEILQYLIELHENDDEAIKVINIRNENTGDTPLLTAAHYGNIQAIKLFGEAGADHGLTNNKGSNALNCVVTGEEPFNIDAEEIMRILIFNDTKKDNTLADETTIMMQICSIGAHRLLESIILGVESETVDLMQLNMQRRDGRTAVHLCCNKGFQPKVTRDMNFPKCLEILCSKRANINLQARDGNTAMHDAVANRYGEAVDILLKYYPDLTLENKDEQTAEDLAAESGQTEISEKIKMLSSSKNRQRLKAEAPVDPLFNEMDELDGEFSESSRLLSQGGSDDDDLPVCCSIS